MEEHHRVLGLDPAIKNYGYSMLEIREDLKAWRIIECGLLLYPLNEISENLIESLDKYEFEMTRMIRMWRPQNIVVERYQNRSRIGASQNEKVNIMIGLAVYMAKLERCNLSVFTAAQWKNKVNAKVDLENIYKATRSSMRLLCKQNRVSKEKQIELVNMTPHSVDATIMALFKGSECAGIDPFSFINLSISDKVVKALAKMKGVLK